MPAHEVATRTAPPAWAATPPLKASPTRSPAPPSSTPTTTPQLNLTLEANRRAILEATLGPVPTRDAGEPGKIAYAVVDLLASSEIYIMDADGRNQTMLLADEETPYGFPIWSPDGLYLAFICGPQLCITYHDGTGFREVTRDLAFRLFPSWHPDGRAIAYGTANNDNMLAVRAIDVTNGSIRPVVPDGFTASWSPDGARIAYLAFDAWNRSQLYVVPSRGRSAEKIIDMEVAFLAWSPDGEHLALAVNETGFGIKHEIYTVRPDGTDLVKLTDNDWDDAYPVWSPDGTRIAFSSNRYGTYDIFVMNADGGALRRLTTSSLEETTPSWQPEA